MTERDDEAWRAIVENYGERAALDDAPTADDPADRADDRDSADRTTDSGADRESGDSATDPADEADDPPVVGPPTDDPDAAIARALAEEEGYVPPPPPPLPYVAPPRLAAGLGVFGAPLVLLVSVVFGISVPSWLGYLLVAAFVGGFAYLVAHMRKRPDDPWDDGARV